MMKTQNLCLVALVSLSSTEAWSTPSPRAIVTEVAKGCATAATCAALLTSSPVMAAQEMAPTTAAVATPSSSSIKVDINAPYLLNLVKTDEARTKTLDRVTFLADSIKNLFGPGVSVELPTDIKGFVREALAGGASIKVNGQDVAVKVVESTSGALTVQVYNKYIPAIPFVGLKNTPSYVGAAASVVENAAPAVVDAVTTVIDESVQEESAAPFWERQVYDLDISVGPTQIQRALTPVDIVGGGSLALGVAYGASYSFYQFEQYQNEKESAEKKRKMQAKKAAAAAAAKKKAAADLEAQTAKEPVLMASAETPGSARTSTSIAAKQEPKKTGVRSKIKSLFRS